MGVLRPNRRCPYLYAQKLPGNIVEHTSPARGHVQVQRRAKLCGGDTEGFPHSWGNSRSWSLLLLPPPPAIPVACDAGTFCRNVVIL